MNKIEMCSLIDLFRGGTEAACVSQFCDVTKWDTLHDLFDTAVREFSQIDIVLANAGIPELEDIFTSTVDAETGKLLKPKYRVLDIDLKGVLASMHATHPIPLSDLFF